MFRVENGLKNYNIENFKIRNLSKPDNLEAEELNPSHYHRIAVACGLSFFYDNIGRTVPPSSIEDIDKFERIRIPNGEYHDCPGNMSMISS